MGDGQEADDLRGTWASASLEEIRRRLAAASVVTRAPSGQDWDFRLVCLRDGADGLEIGVVYTDGAGLVQDWSYPLRFAAVKPGDPRDTDPDIVASIVVTNLFEPSGSPEGGDFDFGRFALACADEVERRLVEEPTLSTELQERGWSVEGVSVVVGSERPEVQITYEGSTDGTREWRSPIQLTSSEDTPAMVAGTIVTRFLDN